jgi:LPXTG-motif cell wall-anchored protein
VFITDGKPNAYGTSGTIESYNYPTESTKAYPPAEATAVAMKNSGTKLFLVAVESSESTQLEYDAMHQHMRKLAQAVYNDPTAYYTADETTLIRILAEIATEINKEYTYKNVTVSDGVTTGSVGTGVNGSVSNFSYTIAKYDENNEIIPETQATVTKNTDNTLTVNFPAIGTPGSDGYIPASTETIPGATCTDGNVQWAMGNHKLHDGYTYTVSFTVWPSQTAYDAITEIKNGTKTYADVIRDHPELADTLTSSGDYVTNKVNSATVSYESYVTVTVGGNTQEYKVGEGTVKMDNPDPEPLSTSTASIRKKWISNMVPGWSVNGEIYLGMERDNDPYWIDWRDPDTRIVVSSTGTEEHPAWTATRFIAPGILVSPTKAAEEGIDVSHLAQVTVDGANYYRLNSGHTYKFTEDKTKNFQLQEKEYHPMIVDGVMRNTTVSGNAYTLEDDDMSELVAINRMRGGINIYKVVKDSEGRVIAPDDPTFTDSFTMHAKITAPVGEVDKFDTTSVAGKTVVWYDIYDINGGVRTDYPERQNNTNYLEFNTTTRIAEGDLPPIKNGEFIRFTNIVTGSLYEVTEVGDNASGYEKTYTYEYIEYDDPINNVAQPRPAEPNPDHIVGQDRQNNVTVTNQMMNSDMVLIKTDEVFTPITSASDTAVFWLMRNTKLDGTGVWENAEADSGVAADGTVTVNSADGVTLTGLRDGLYKLQETKSPGGYIINDGTVYFRLMGGQIRFCQVEGSGTSATVTEIETPEGFSVVEKTNTTPVALKVANTPGEPLPHTGGNGKTIYTLGGLAVMASALVYGFGLRRRRERRFNE